MNSDGAKNSENEPRTENPRTLDSLRRQIDDLDRQIVELLARRLELARRIGAYKAAHGLPVLDEVREAQLIADRSRQSVLAGGHPCDEIFRLILEQSRLAQAKVRQEPGPEKKGR